MTTITENDIKELNQKIDKLTETVTQLVVGQNEIRDEIKNSDIKITEIDKKLATVETRLQDWKPSIDKITDLTEKVGELKNWKQIGLVVITAFISSIFSGSIGGVIGWLIKSAK